jgi:uncharacterized membrane protein YraQ (UPF0718 family)
MDAFVHGLEMAFFMFWDTLWPLIFGFVLSGIVQAFVSRERMQRLMGDRSVGSLGRATFLGMVSSSCSYAATAMARSLFLKGADFVAAMVFMFASTNLVLELGIILWVLMGWPFAVAEFVGGAIMIVLLAVFARLLPGRLIEEAGRKLESTDEHEHVHGGGGSEGRPSWRNRAGWESVASYTMADLMMLRRELVLGYTIAGFLAVLVSNEVWNRVFFHGHGFLTVLENVLIGPFIAIVSFVCSVGNVPLAAALWQGGISFGGVVSFIFADLITLPLLLIYRKFYGTRLALWLLALFWSVMSLAGLATEGIFAALGAIPERRPIALIEEGLKWNYTTWLNIIFLVVFFGIWWLDWSRARRAHAMHHG